MTTRLFFSIGFAMCALFLSVGYFLQYGLGLEPCPLCILDRLTLFATLIIFGLAILHNPKKMAKIIYLTLSTLTILAGLIIASRHLYLQHLPLDKIPECGPGFDYLIKNFPLSEVFQMLFHGSGQCARIGTRFLGLSLAQWTEMAFIILLLWNISPFVKMFKDKAQR